MGGRPADHTEEGARLEREIASLVDRKSEESASARSEKLDNDTVQSESTTRGTTRVYHRRALACTSPGDKPTGAGVAFRLVVRLTGQP